MSTTFVTILSFSTSIKNTIQSHTTTESTIHHVTTTVSSISTGNYITKTKQLSTMLPVLSQSRLTNSLSTTITSIPSSVSSIIHSYSSTSHSSDMQLSGIATSSKSNSGKTIGLSIGLPIGIFCLCLAIFLCYFYFMKKSITQSHIPISASGTPDTHNGWLSSIFHGNSKNYDIEKEALNEKGWPFGPQMSSKIQYKISKPVPQHILTPKKVADILPQTGSTQNINTYLYSKPPNIYHIGSSLSHTPSSSNLDKNYIDGRDSSLSKPHRWNYDSPLSGWFLRGSTYFKDKSNILSATTSKMTPTIQLKKLKIISRIHSDHNDKQMYENESSPILEKSSYSRSTSTSISTSDSSPNEKVEKVDIVHEDDSTKQKNDSRLYGAIEPQTLDPKQDGDMENFEDIHLENVPKTRNKTSSKKQRKFRRHLDKVSRSKPLPLTPDSKNCKLVNGLVISRVYHVAQDYSPRLADEIQINKGEYVKILASHTDGWCLVEKCSIDGTVNSKIVLESEKYDIDDKQYLNEDRGIVPSDCLEDCCK